MMPRQMTFDRIENLPRERQRFPKTVLALSYLRLRVSWKYLNGSIADTAHFSDIPQQGSFQASSNLLTHTWLLWRVQQDISHVRAARRNTIQECLFHCSLREV